MKRSLWKRLTFICASLLMFMVLIKLNGNMTSFIQYVKHGDAVYSFSQITRSDDEKKQLLELIKNEAEKLKQPAVNAKIDPVYKAIPGYNGLEVNIESTYELNVNRVRGAQISYVYKEIEPVIQLEDLGSQPIYRGNELKKSIGLMINVAWGNEYIDSILETLRHNQVKATFFFDGSWLKKNKDIALKIQADGHELSNHAYSHPNMADLSREAQAEEIRKTEALLKELNVHNKWFAPPSGSFNSTTVKVAREQGLFTVLWTIDTIDWRKPPVDKVMSRIEGKVQPGSLILMHPTISTEQALPRIIQYLKEQGYQPGTVSQTLSSDRLHDYVEGVDIF